MSKAEFSVTVQARIGPGLDRDQTFALIDADTHVELNGSTGGGFVRLHRDVTADDASVAVLELHTELRDRIAAAGLPAPAVWEARAEPRVDLPWWQR